MKGNAVVVHSGDAPVAQSHAVNVGSKVFHRSSSVADRGAVDDPILVPCLKRNAIIQFELLEFVSKLAAKESPERGAMNQKVLVLGIDPSFSIEAESTARYQIVNVYVIIEVALPGLQDTDCDP